MSNNEKKTAAEEHTAGVARAKEILARSHVEPMELITPESLRKEASKTVTAEWERMMAAYAGYVREHCPKIHAEAGLTIKKRFKKLGLNKLLFCGESTEFFELALIRLLKFSGRTEISEAELALAIGCIVLADIAEVGENLDGDE